MADTLIRRGPSALSSTGYTPIMAWSTSSGSRQHNEKAATAMQKGKALRRHKTPDGDKRGPLATHSAEKAPGGASTGPAPSSDRSIGLVPCSYSPVKPTRPHTSPPTHARPGKPCFSPPCPAPKPPGADRPSRLSELTEIPNVGAVTRRRPGGDGVAPRHRGETFGTFAGIAVSD